MSERDDDRRSGAAGQAAGGRVLPPSPWRLWLLGTGYVGSLLGVLVLGVALVVLSSLRPGGGSAHGGGLARWLALALPAVWCLAPVVGAVASEWLPDRRRGATGEPYRGSTLLLLYLTAYPAVALPALQRLFDGEPPTWLVATAWASLAVCAATAVVHTVRVPGDVHLLRALRSGAMTAVMTDARLDEPAGAGRRRPGAPKP